ncbi:MAG TPA: DNA repair protein RecO [Pyrinomonadaceae bacterium]|jgi:DNA repair protein RecO (recombination protein O)
MGLVETEAIVLRSYNLAEADKIVVCLARSTGLVRVVAHGARRLKSRFGAGLEPFTHVQISYYEKEGRDLANLQQLEIMRSYFSLAENAEAVAALSYMSELVLEFAPPHEPNERLFRMVCATLSALKESPQDLQAFVRYFEVWTLRLAGFLPDLRACADCGRGFADREGAFVNAEGRLRCVACGQGGGATLSAEALAQLKSAQKLSPTDFAQRTRGTGVRTQAEVAEVTQRLIKRVLERAPRGAATFIN